MISVRCQGKPFNITVIQVHALTSIAKEAEVEQFYVDLQDLLELTHTPQKKKRCRVRETIAELTLTWKHPLLTCLKDLEAAWQLREAVGWQLEDVDTIQSL